MSSLVFVTLAFTQNKFWGEDLQCALESNKLLVFRRSRIVFANCREIHWFPELPKLHSQFF